ncbi:MAG TPA: septum formation initiator family protein [Candidatus Dormibacteraeota bacterium]|jgi:cell division protein FtsB
MSRRRPSKTSRPRFITAGRVGTIVLLASALWLGSGLVSRMVFAYRLNTQVRTMQGQNDKISQANLEYRQQLQALSRPAGAEEQARAHNYVKPDEKVYVVTQPSPVPSPRPAATIHKQNPVKSKPNFWADFWSALTSPFH